jgi:hypothetical protein
MSDELVHIPDQHDPDGSPWTYPAGRVWPHRVVFTVNGREVLNASLADIIIRAALRNEPETRVEIHTHPLFPT